jgi:negative regulator of genetic competence, sporulation and motility
MVKKDAYHPSDGSLGLLDSQSNLQKGNRSSKKERTKELFDEVMERLEYFRDKGKLWLKID